MAYTSPSVDEDLFLARVSWRRTTAKAAELQLTYRDFGLRFYDLSSDVQAQLIADTENNVARAYVATSDEYRPTLADSLNALSESLEGVAELLRTGKDSMALIAMQDADLELSRLRDMCTGVFAAIYRIYRHLRRDLHSDLQQARAGLVPEQLLAWCRSIREVKVALKLEAIEDDPYQILAFVVDEEERPRVAPAPEYIVNTEGNRDTPMLVRSV